jgi:mono/diheme cytochrome c family protein
MKRAAAVLVLSLVSCRADAIWPASMEDQPSVGATEGAPRPQPEESVPAGGIEAVDDREDLEDLKNPQAGDPGSPVHGAWLFTRFCTHCHGAAGHGGGPVSDKFPPAPDLRHASVCKRSDGFLYGTLTVGGRAMPSMREGLSRRDRWDLVSFLRDMQQKEGCVGTSVANDAPTKEGTP